MPAAMQEVTLALAVLLGVGFICAKLAQRFKLPSVTGYICAGLLLGPSGLALITPHSLGNRLDHFTQIALMLVAFGVGEHLELKRLRKNLPVVGVIAFCEGLSAFAMVAGGVFAAALAVSAGPEGWSLIDYGALALLVGAIAAATAPASTIQVLREMKACGSLSSTLMQVVAIDNGLAIMLFGAVVALVQHMIGATEATMLGAMMQGALEIVVSIAMGVTAGLLIDFVAHRLESRGEILTIGLALLLLCGELARYFGFSALLTGVAAGFTIVNRDHRDVRFFRALNAFEAPIFVLFFTLAGAHLDLGSLAMAGFLGLVYFAMRLAGKYTGVRLSIRAFSFRGCPAPDFGLALLPQADLAIGLLFLVKSNAALTSYMPLITPIILAGVLLAELSGPVSVRRVLERAGEGGKTEKPEARYGEPCAMASGSGLVRLVPWIWERLTPPPEPHGLVLFGASHPATVAAIARITTIAAHHYQARPCAVRVITPDLGRYYETIKADATGLFAVEKAEVKALGYELDTEIVKAESVAHGLLHLAATREVRAIVLGAPVDESSQAFERVIELVASEAPCEVIVVRFAGVLHTECILVPVVGMAELETLKDILAALAAVGRHRITLFRLLPAEASREDISKAEKKLAGWASQAGFAALAHCRVAATEDRLETIVQEAGRHDLLIMAASQTSGLRRLIFGSLAEKASQRCNRPMLMVHGPKPPGPEEAEY